MRVGVAAEAQTPAIATPGSTNATAPVPGKNSFTEDQARKRITDAGYSDVTDLKLGDQGFWVATATKGAATVQVTMDYQGNIVAR
nr:PepSY domain-containing protein [uncultured Gellertiella sp.]